MSQIHARIAELEEEVRSLKTQLTQTHEHALLPKTLNNLFAYSNEVVLCVVNDERLTVKTISESISTYGYTPEEFTSGRLGWRDVLPPDDYSSLLKDFSKQINNDITNSEHEYHVITKSGEVVWTTCVFAPEYTIDGEIVHFGLKIKDISKRKLYEEKLQDANENLFVTLKSIGETVIQLDANGRIERLNGAAERLVGIINLKAKNKWLNDIMQFSLTPEFDTIVDPLKMKSETGKMVLIDEVFMRCSNNDKHFRVSCNVSPIYIGKNKAALAGYVVVVKDLTTLYDMLQAAQESEARIQKSESTIRGIFDHSADGILLADRNGIIREWSSGYERISGIPKETTIGKTIWEVAAMGFPFDQSNKEKLDAELKQLTHDMRQKMIVRHVIHRKTGEHRILHILYFPVVMSEEKMLGAISRDVTEEVRSQELLQQNEQKLTAERDRMQTLGDNMPNGCLYQFTLNVETQQMGFTYMSRSWEHITGISVEDAIGNLNLLMARIHPDDLPVYMQAFENSLMNMERFNVEIRFMLDEGMMRWGRISSTPHPEGPNVVWDGFIVDITENKLAEQKIIVEKERLQALGDNMPNGCLYRTVTDVKTMEMKFAYLSGTCERILNVSTETAIQDISNVLRKVHPDDIHAMMRHIYEAAQAVTDYNDEVRYLYNDTDPRWIQISSHPHMEGEMLVYDGFILDITDRKRVEQKMIAEKERMEALGDNLPDGCLFRFMMDNRTQKVLGFTYLSRTWEIMTGVSVENTLADFESTLAMVHPDDLPIYVQSIEESAANMSKFSFEFRFRRDDGYTVWFKALSSPHLEDNMVVWDGFILNITERKLSEQALIAEKDRLQALGDYFPNGCLFRFNYDEENRKFSFSYLSRTWEKLTGISLDDGLHNIDFVLSKIHPDDLASLVNRAWKTHDELQENFDAEFRFFYAPDNMRWLQISTHRHYENEQTVSDGFILDITDRKNAEQQLMSEKERLETLGDNIPEGALFRYRSRNLQEYMVFDYVSATWEKTTGVTDEDTLKDVRNVFMHVHPDDLPAMMEKFDESAIKMINLNTEARYLHPDGSMRWFQIASHPHHEGEFVVSDGYLLDITKRKLAENELLLEKERLQSLGDNFPNGALFRFIFDISTQKMVIGYLSESWTELSGIPKEEAMKDVNIAFSSVLPEDLLVYMQAVQESVLNLSRFNVEIRYKKRYNEEIRWMQISSQPRKEDKSIICDGFMLDITERKNAEQQLLSEKERLQALGGNLPEGALFRYKSDTIVKENMYFDYLSTNWEKILGTSMEDTLKDSFVFFNQIHPEDLPVVMEKLYESGKTLSNLHIEARYLHPDGTIRWIQASSHPHMEGSMIVSDGVIMDISKRKLVEEKLAAEQAKLKSLTDNVPTGCLCQFAIHPQMKTMRMAYMSDNWERILNSPAEASKEDANVVFSKVHEADLPRFMAEVLRTTVEMVPFNVEIRYQYTEEDLRWLQISGAPRYEGEWIIFDGMVMDTTARKVAEQQLLAEKERVETLGNNLPNGSLFRFKTFHETQVTSFEYVSATWEQVTGISAEETLKDVTAVMGRIHPEDMPELGIQLYKSCEDMSDVDAEARFLHPDGSVRWIHLASHPHMENGAVVSDGFLLDITDRKQAERELHAEKERLQALGDNMPNGTLFRCIMNTQTEKMWLDYVSGTWEKLLGVSEEECLKDIQTVFDHIAPEDLSRFIEEIYESVLTLKNIETILHYLPGDGSEKWFQVSAHPHREGDLVYSDGFVLDITDRKNAEQLLFNEKNRLQALGDNFPGGTLFRFKMDMQTEEMSFDYVSGTWEKFSGIPIEKSLADIRVVLAHIVPDDLPRLIENINISAKLLENIDTAVRYLHPDGTIRWYQISSHPHREDHVVYSDGFILDITARKNAENALFAEKERLQALGDNFPDGTLFRFKMDVQTGTMSFDYVSGTWEKTLGVSVESSLADIHTVFAHVAPDDLPHLIEGIRESVETLENINVEIRYIHPVSRMERWYQISSHPHREDNIVYSDGFILDITARKTAEQELRSEKDRLEALGNNIPDGCLYRFSLDPITGVMKMLYVSATWGEVTGVSSDRAMKDIAAVFERVYPEDYLCMVELIQKNVKTLSNFEMELRFHLNEETRWVQLISRPHMEDNFVIWDGILLDVTWRKEAERKLIAEKDRLETLGNNLPDGSLYRLILNRDTDKMYMEYVSATWEMVTGLTPDSVIEDMKPFFDIVHPEDLPYLMEVSETSGNDLTNANVEIRINNKGNIRWIQIASHPHAEGNTVVWDGIMTDITRRKEAEQELETEKDRLQALGDNIPGGCLYRFILDAQTGQMHISYVSATWETVTGVSADAAIADISSVFGAVYPEDLVYLQQAIQKSAQTMTNFNCEIRVADYGRPRWVQMASHPHFEGVNIVWDGIILDVTRRKEAERELTTEKDRLQALGDNFPGGTLFRFEVDAEQFTRSDANSWLQHLKLSYASATWEKISNTSLDQAMQNISVPFVKILPEDLAEIIPQMHESLNTLIEFNTEIRYNYTDSEMRWLQIAAVPRREDDRILTDGFILDITERKNIETELTVYREELERLVKERTEELEATNEELYATNEELYATNEEFAVTNEELHTKNDQLRNEIAARMEVMKKLEDSESKVRSFIEQSFEGIMILDSEGHIIEWNRSLETMTKLARNEAMGCYEWDLLRNFLSGEDLMPENFEKLRQSRLQYLREGRNLPPVTEELTLYMPDRTKRYMQVSMFPIGLADTCYFGRILHDITEQKLTDMELEQYRTQLEQMVEVKTRELVVSQERLVSLSNNLPGGVIYQLMDKNMETTWFSYISAYFTDMFEISVDEVMADPTPFYMCIYPEDQQRLMTHYASTNENSDIDIEYRIRTKSGNTKWIHMRSSHHSIDDNIRVWDGFMIDITDRKLAEQELENTRRQQAILIKVLQVVQSADNLPNALNISLAEMGKYTGVSRVYIFEKNVDGTIVNNTYEWCNEGIGATIDGMQNIPIEYMQDWFDTFNAGKYICTSDVNTLSPTSAQALKEQGVKSILVFPLSANGVNYGFVGFDDCESHREWEQSELELLISLSQIISTTTHRYHAETATQLSQQTMRTVLDNINANIYVADFDSWNILFANKKIKEAMGCNVEGQPCWQALQKEKDGPCDFCPSTHLLNGQNRPTGLYHWEQWNSKTQRWYESTDAAIEWVDGRLVHMEYATDITDRKRAEEALRQSEEMYRQLTVASPDAIVVCSPDGKVRYVSPKAAELFEIEENIDVNVLRMPSFVHPHDRRQAYHMFGSLVKDNVAFLPQLLLLRKDSSEFIGEISSATVKDTNGGTTSIIMVIRDITQRKLSEIELIRAKEKAEESDKLKSAFLANMSHEIRTPLNGIVGFLNFLGSENLSSQRRQEYINIINNSSAQLIKLIDDIIDVAKIEAKQMSIRPVPCRINDLMSELQVFFETYLRASNKDRIAMILDDSGFIDSCVAFVDPMRLRQVINNLVGNAIKFTEKGFIRFGYKQSAPNKLEFVVEDSGIGLAQNQLEVIFERFRQAELSNNRQYGGTGLGLTISRSLVQIMGGDMRVESIEDVGSSFYFTISYLPVAPADEYFFDELPEEKSSIEKPFHNKVVLVVESEIMKYKYYEKLLSANGISVIQAENLQQWFDYISQTNHVDAVIADVAVFNHTDDEIMGKIKSIRAGLPTILLTSEQPNGYQQVIGDSQYNMVLTEPVDDKNLLGALKKYLR